MSHKHKHRRRLEDNCRDCGAPIRLVLVIPIHPIKGEPRRYLPLDPTYDPTTGTRPSHAVSTGWTTCRPLPVGDSPGPDEWPAITHFATCPTRRPSSTAVPTGATTP